MAIVEMGGMWTRNAMRHVDHDLPVMCPWCQESEDDAEHLLHLCPRFQHAREQGWGGDVPD
eukprot:15095492-Alexandrium_andersonii.AAC.1